MGKKSVAMKDPVSQEKDDTKSNENVTKDYHEDDVVPPPSVEKPLNTESEEIILSNQTPLPEKPKANINPTPVVEVKEDTIKKPPTPTVINKPTPIVGTANLKTAPNAVLPNKIIQPRKYTNVPAKNPIVLEEKIFYTIQLGAFSSQEQANKFKENVNTKNKFPGKYVPYILKQRDFFVVRVGKSTAKEELEKIVQVEKLSIVEGLQSRGFTN